MDGKQILNVIIQPLRSRKTRVAVATVCAAYLSQRYGLSDQTIYTILSVGVAVILGIAHEDNGAKQVVELEEFTIDSKEEKPKD